MQFSQIPCQVPAELVRPELPNQVFALLGCKTFEVLALPSGQALQPLRPSNRLDLCQACLSRRRGFDEPPSLGGQGMKPLGIALGRTSLASSARSVGFENHRAKPRFCILGARSRLQGESSLNSRGQRSMLASRTRCSLAVVVERPRGRLKFERRRCATWSSADLWQRVVRDRLSGKMVERPRVENVCRVKGWRALAAPERSHWWGFGRTAPPMLLPGQGIAPSGTGLWHETCILPIMRCKPNAYRSAGAQRGSSTGRLKQHHHLNPDQP